MPLRRPLSPRVGRPGLIGTAARTAVIAGTATAASGAVQRRQSAKAEANYERQQYEAAQQQAQVQAAAQQAAAQYAPAASAAPAGGQDPMLAQLQQLGQMHASGILTDAEFAAAKARLLGT